ncbi:MAG: MmgE/PrpD family protein [Deltaproteobacteria bacterium]|nr:MmgE/PrpD family protein [Deltaproteobacteria bacterium]
MHVNLSDQFIDDLFDLCEVRFPHNVVHQAKRCLLDYLGVTFAGAWMLKEKGEKLLDLMRGGAGDSAVIGFDRKASVENAAFINGLSSHVAELDDGVRFGMIHPGAPVFSALLSVAEKERVHGADFIKGIIVGYEAEVRLACAIQPSHYGRGYHPTSTCGTIGAAMGISAMLGFTKKEMKDTLSAAAVSAAGTLKVIEDGSEIKPFNVGRAAVNALLATYVARAGFKGLDDVFCGDAGFFSMMADECNVEELKRVDGGPYAVEKAYVKPYAACRHAHPAIEAALKIKADKRITVDTIKEIKVLTYRTVIGKHDHTEISGSPSAKMSIPYGLAVALMTGKAGIDQFNSEHVNNSNILSLVEKISVCADDEISNLVPKQRAAIVEVLTYAGDYFSERIDYPKGEPENPLSDSELEAKFSLLASYGKKNDKEIHEITNVVWSLEKELQKLFELL